MKPTNAMSFVLGLMFLAAAITASAADHVTPVAPQEYLDMESAYDEDDVDDVFIKANYRVYKSKCSKCHGSEGDGEGSASEEIIIKPTAFNVEGYFDEKSDGQLFWIINYGSEGTEMEAFGPESDAGFSEDKIWGLVAYIRAEFGDD
jgi:mono/diheme cytochrome c family protein